MTPSSFCYTSDERTIQETALSILSLLRFSPLRTLHIYVRVNSEYTKKLLSNYLCLSAYLSGNLSITFEVGEFVIPDVISHSNYHHRGSLLAKIETILNAVRKWGDSLYIDSDVIFLDGLPDVAKSYACLSWNDGVETAKNPFGKFNAGMIWVSSLEIPVWWINAFKNNVGGFYEQGCLDEIPEKWSVSYFDELDNWGWWRRLPSDQKPRSVHLHLHQDFDKYMTQGCRTMTDNLRRWFWKNAPSSIICIARSIFSMPCSIAISSPIPLGWVDEGESVGISIAEVAESDIGINDATDKFVFVTNPDSIQPYSLWDDTTVLMWSPEAIMDLSRKIFGYPVPLSKEISQEIYRRS